MCACMLVLGVCGWRGRGVLRHSWWPAVCVPLTACAFSLRQFKCGCICEGWVCRLRLAVVCVSGGGSLSLAPKIFVVMYVGVEGLRRPSVPMLCPFGGGWPTFKAMTFVIFSFTFPYEKNWFSPAHIMRALLTGFRLTNEKAMAAVDQWKKVQNSGVVSLKEAFTSKEFGDHCTLTPPPPRGFPARPLPPLPPLPTSSFPLSFVCMLSSCLFGSGAWLHIAMHGASYPSHSALSRGAVRVAVQAHQKTDTQTRMHAWSLTLLRPALLFIISLSRRVCVRLLPWRRDTQCPPFRDQGRGSGPGERALVLHHSAHSGSEVIITLLLPPFPPPLRETGEHMHMHTHLRNARRHTPAPFFSPLCENRSKHAHARIPTQCTAT